jgi:hypothetical protein
LFGSFCAQAAMMDDTDPVQDAFFYIEGPDERACPDGL